MRDKNVGWLGVGFVYFSVRSFKSPHSLIPRSVIRITTRVGWNPEGI